MSSGQAIRLESGVWDSDTFVLTSTTEIVLAATPRGQGTTIWGGSGGRSASDTFFKQAGQLGAGYHLVARAAAIYWDPLASPTDIAKVTRDGWMTLGVGSSTHLEIPLERLTAGSGIIGFAGAAATALFGQNGVADPRAVFNWSPQVIEWGGQDQFVWKLNWTTTITTSANVKFRVSLLGQLDRPI